MSVQKTQLFVIDDKCKAILVDMTSVSTISELTDEKQIKKLPAIPTGKIIPNISDYFIDKKCDIKMKQEQPLLGFQKPGGFYSVLVSSISDEVVTAQNMKGNSTLSKCPISYLSRSVTKVALKHCIR